MYTHVRRSQKSSPDIPVGESVFDVVAGGVDEDPSLVPPSTLQAHVLIHRTQTLQLAVADGQNWWDTRGPVKTPHLLPKSGAYKPTKAVKERPTAHNGIV